MPSRDITNFAVAPLRRVRDDKPVGQKPANFPLRILNMSIERAKAIEWDGKVLTGWITVDGKPIKVSADRETIHRHAPGWNDALTWEIERHREDIFEKLTPCFRVQHG